MITCMLHIRVRAGCEEQAIDTLSAIERRSRQDAGRVNFSWLQDQDDPYQFTLFEQWRSQDDLDRHLHADPAPWERFVPCLAQEPRSQTLRPVAELAAPLTSDEVKQFVHVWFDTLSAHPPVEELLPMILTDRLVMEFPEDTLTSEAEFRAWYDQVGRSYYDQSHSVQQLEVRLDPSTREASIELSVIWSTRQSSDGARLVFRADQSWRIVRSFRTGRPAITEYRVARLVPVSDAAPAGRG